MIALFCIVVYAGSLLYGAFRVYRSIESQKQRAVTELDGIQNHITQNNSGFFTEPVREEIKKRLADSSALQGIIITWSDGNIPFEKEAGAVIRYDPSPGFIPRFGYTALQARQIDLPGFRNVSIHSVFNTINYENLVLVLRQTLIAILGALLISFLTMIVTLLRSRSASNAGIQIPDDKISRTDYSSQTDFLSQTAASPEADISFPDSFDDMEEPVSDGFSDDEDFAVIGDDAGDVMGGDDFSVPEPDMPGDEGMDDDFSLPDFDDFSGSEAAPAADDGFHLDDFLDEEEFSLPESQSTDEPQSAPNGLYSPRSNLGWEAYTQDRLASELHRCASSEQDLVVLLMECGEGVNCDAVLYKKIADEAVGQFNLHDLTFENGSSGITVIIPNCGLDQGISMAEAFHARLFKSCYESFHSKNDFLTGISSRSGRLIEADRLLLEAGKALEKAKVDAGSPIVAFKSDPEKYREYVKKSASQN